MSGTVEQSNGVPGPSSSVSTLPPVAAVFCVKFDDRKGYTIAWHRSLDDVKIDGMVEYKCLPSGLHNVKEDLVYFVHDDHVGVSASLNVQDDQAARKARVLAVGVLIPLEHGRMGKSWLHAENLNELARKQVASEDDYASLESYWNDHKIPTSSSAEEAPESPTETKLVDSSEETDKPAGYQLARAMSLGINTPMAEHVLPKYHPALDLLQLLHLFGPLIFPLVRAALLRKRILILGEAPVKTTCNYVYNLSILSSLPRPIASLLSITNPDRLRVRPLYNIGVADISLLESESLSSGGWIACTTDDVICTKPDLFDVLVTLPNAASLTLKRRTHPRIYFSSTELSKVRPKYGIRASQRDAKRFATLWKGLQSMPRSNREVIQVPSSPAVESPSDESHPPVLEGADGPGDTASIASTASSTLSIKSVVEPQSWSQIAYTSLIWWASAGDKRGLSEAEEDEAEQDVALLTGEGLEDDDDGFDEETKTREVSCVAYFHRLANLMFTALEEVVRRADRDNPSYTDEEDEETNDTAQQDTSEEDQQALLQHQPRSNASEDDRSIDVTPDDVQNMGLDVWSSADQKFIVELAKLWWGRKVEVQGGRIECCGVRLL